MSEEWPNRWYRDGQGRRAQPSFSPRHDAEGSPSEATPYEPAQAGPPATDKPLPKNLITGASVAGTT